jgi:hypothetical protein
MLRHFRQRTALKQQGKIALYPFANARPMPQ